MYSMRNIIDHSEEINLPKCMYHVRNPNESLKNELYEIEIGAKICNQAWEISVIDLFAVADHILTSADHWLGTIALEMKKVPSSKMSELEQRQEVLIKKLDALYDRIKTISSYCNLSNSLEENNMAVLTVPTLEEVVLVINADYMPWYLKKIPQKATAETNLSWHIHSSVPSEKVAKIKGFLQGLKTTGCQSKISIRVIFKSGIDSELRLSSLAVPIMGTVNILRYLSYAYPDTLFYDDNDFQMDSLLDVCHILEKTSDKNKEDMIKKLFSDCKDWIYKNKFSVVDLAAYNVIKQSKSSIKYAPKPWFDKCEKMCV